jgi:hypothetical protein
MGSQNSVDLLCGCSFEDLLSIQQIFSTIIDFLGIIHHPAFTLISLF